MSAIGSRSIAEIEALFEGAAMAESYGEDLSIRNHMLQCAEIAVRQDLDDALIAAELLHDIGWAMSEGSRPHEEIGAKFLRSRLGAVVADPVQLHVLAKRYLVATRADYLESLSGASRGTLIRQDGPLTPRECYGFEQLPGHARALQLRLIDDERKASDPIHCGFKDFVPVLERVAAQVEIDHRGYSNF